MIARRRRCILHAGNEALAKFCVICASELRYIRPSLVLLTGEDLPAQLRDAECEYVPLALERGACLESSDAVYAGSFAAHWLRGCARYSL